MTLAALLLHSIAADTLGGPVAMTGAVSIRNQETGAHKQVSRFTRRGGRSVFLCARCGSVVDRAKDWLCPCDVGMGPPAEPCPPEDQAEPSDDDDFLDFAGDGPDCTTPHLCTRNNGAKCCANPCGWVEPF